MYPPPIAETDAFGWLPSVTTISLLEPPAITWFDEAADPLITFVHPPPINAPHVLQISLLVPEPTKLR